MRGKAKKKKGKRAECLTTGGIDLALIRDSDGCGNRRGDEEEADDGGELHFDGFDLDFLYSSKE